MADLANRTETRSPVFPFDIFADPRLRDDVHEGYLNLREEAPGLFWTPAVRSRICAIPSFHWLSSVMVTSVLPAIKQV